MKGDANICFRTLPRSSLECDFFPFPIFPVKKKFFLFSKISFSSFFSDWPWRWEQRYLLQDRLGKNQQLCTLFRSYILFFLCYFLLYFVLTVFSFLCSFLLYFVLAVFFFLCSFLFYFVLTVTKFLYLFFSFQFPSFLLSCILFFTV